MTDKHITLAGAGLVGSLLAVFLAKRGYKVDVYERREDMRKAHISAGRSINLALANRGIRPLEQVGLMEQVSKMLIPMKGRMVHDTNGNSNFQSYGQHEHEVIYSVSRGELNKLMLDAAEATGNVTVHFEQQLQKVDFDSKNLTVLNAQGKQQSVEFNRLIGTDGAGSLVRKAVMTKVGEQDYEQPLGHAYKELSIPAGPNGSFQIEKEALHIWPRGGFMLIALPNLDGSFTVTLFMPSEGEVSFDSVNTPEALDNFFQQYFADLKPLLTNLHQEYFDNPTGKLATVRCAPWHYQDLGLLLGDAAHAVVPFHGQGMNCGFEDVAEFAAQIDSVNNSGTVETATEWLKIFAATDEARFVNGNAIADMAIENYIEMRDSVLQPDYLLKKQIAFQLEKWFPKRFTPRYSMVMFHHIPYSEAQRLGEIHQGLLANLANQISDIEDLDQQQAELELSKAGL